MDLFNRMFDSSFPTLSRLIRWVFFTSLLGHLLGGLTSTIMAIGSLFNQWKAKGKASLILIGLSKRESSQPRFSLSPLCKWAYYIA